MGEKRPVGAVASALKILRYLANKGRPSRLTEVSRAADLLPSTCLAILHTLATDGFVMRDDSTKTYTLGYGALDLARSLLRSDIFVQFLVPELQAVADRYDLTCTIWRRVDQDEIMFVTVVTGARATRLEVDLGARGGLMLAATGRLLALQGGLTLDEVAEYFGRVPWQTPLPLDRFLAEAEEARRRGWAIDRGDYNPRLTSVAVAAPSSGPTVDRGVTATMFVDQHDDVTIERIAHDLQEVARHLFHT